MRFACRKLVQNGSKTSPSKRAATRKVLQSAAGALLIALLYGCFLAALADPANLPSGKAADTPPAEPKGAANASEMSIDEMLNLGSKQLEDKLYFSAVETFTNCLEKDPANARAFAGRARAYRESGDTEKALLDEKQGQSKNALPVSQDQSAPADKTAETKPASPAELAAQLMKKGDYQSALNQLNIALKAKPNQAELLSDRAGCWIMLYKFDKVKADLDLALKLNAKLDTAYARQAQLDNKHKDFTQAIVNAGRSIQLNPKQSLAYAVRAVTLSQTKQMPQAIKDVETAIANDPDSGYAYFTRGLLNLIQKNDKALSDFNKTIDLSPNFIDTYQEVAQLYADKRQWDKCVDTMSKCIRNNPRSVAAYKTRSQIFYLLTRYSDSLYDANKIVELEPNSANSYMARIEPLVALNRQNEAFQDCVRGLSHDPKNAMLYAQRGALYMFREQYDYGIADCSKAMTCDPKCATAYVNRGACYAAQEKYGPAAADLVKATALSPNDKVAWRNLGSVYCYQSKYPQAIICYTKSINIDPRFASVYHDRGRTYRIIGKFDLASRDLAIARALGYRSQ